MREHKGEKNKQLRKKGKKDNNQEKMSRRKVARMH
jgi:hypothetical protein